MIFEPTPLKGSYVVRMQRQVDERGWFARTFDKEGFESIGYFGEWVQMNHSYTKNKGTIRGMHFQLPPYREIKLVRCIRGEVYDVFVDIRAGSPTFCQWFGVNLSAEEGNMIFIPEGFAHGFQTISDDAELIYCHSARYVPGSEGGILYNEQKLDIRWPLPAGIISVRDSNHEPISESFKGI